MVIITKDIINKCNLILLMIFIANGETIFKSNPNFVSSGFEYKNVFWHLHLKTIYDLL